MSNLLIRREHELDEDECWELAEDLLGQLVDKFGGNFYEDGECLRYKHPAGMKAYVEPKDGELEIGVKLNLMTRSFAPEIEKQINRVLDNYI